MSLHGSGVMAGGCNDRGNTEVTETLELALSASGLD